MSLIELFNNYCPICYTSNLRWHYNTEKSQVEVFKCPICREKGQLYFQSFGIVAPDPWNTLDEWKNVFYSFIPHSLNCDISKIPKTSFGKVYGNLMLKSQNYAIKKREKKLWKIKITKQIIKKKRKEEERKKAICIKCGTHCNSFYQLNKHINSKKCIKLQKKK